MKERWLSSPHTEIPILLLQAPPKTGYFTGSDAGFVALCGALSTSATREGVSKRRAYRNTTTSGLKEDLKKRQHHSESIHFSVHTSDDKEWYLNYVAKIWVWVRCVELVFIVMLLIYEKCWHRSGKIINNGTQIDPSLKRIRNSTAIEWTECTAGECDGVSVGRAEALAGSYFTCENAVD